MSKASPSWYDYAQFPSGDDLMSQAPRHRCYEDDPYEVWADAYNAMRGLDAGGAIPDDFFIQWAGLQTRFNTASRAQCRGHFIRHHAKAKWCHHPICPSCWVNKEIAIRAAITESQGPWLISVMETFFPNEAATIPPTIWRRFTGQKRPQQRVVAWSKIFVRDPSFESQPRAAEGKPFDSGPLGWACSFMGVFLAPGIPKFRHSRLSAIPGWVLEAVNDFGFIDHCWTDDREEVLDVWREKSKFPAAEFVPGQAADYDINRSFLKYLDKDPIGMQLRASRTYQTLRPK